MAARKITKKPKSAPAEPPKKRFGGPSGKAGKHHHPAHIFRAPKEFRAVLDRAIEHNADGPNPGGYQGFSDWVRHHLALAAADELGMDPADVLALLRE